MSTSIINPFVEATVNVLRTMSQSELKVGKIENHHSSKSFGIVTGIIGMVSEKAAGNLIISFDQPSILGIVSRMFMEECTELNHEVSDAVGEITNMVCGGAKASLEPLGHNFNMASPLTVIGEGIEITQMAGKPITRVNFHTQDGSFVIESSISET